MSRGSHAAAAPRSGPVSEDRLKYFHVGFIPLNTALETGLEILIVSRTFIRSEIPTGELRIEAFGLSRHQVMKFDAVSVFGQVFLQ